MKLCLSIYGSFLVYGTVTHIEVVGRDAFQNELDFQCNGFSTILKHQSKQFFNLIAIKCLDI